LIKDSALLVVIHFIPFVAAMVIFNNPTTVGGFRAPYLSFVRS